MKIDRIEVFHLDIPLKPRDVRRLTFAGGIMKMDVAQDVVVKAWSDGTFGVGMTPTAAPYLGQVQSTVSAAAKYLAATLLGIDPFRIEYINQVMDWNLPGHEPAKCAIDMALYDLLGKITGRPAYDLLGGKRRDSFVSTISLAAQEPEEMAEWAKMRCDQGFRGLEVHLGDTPGSGAAKDVRRMRAVREAVGADVVIVGDVHRNWTVKEAIAGAEALAPFDLVIESPCRGVHALAQVKAQSKVPIGADEDCHTVQHAIDIIRRDAADFVTVKPAKAGGLTKAKRLATIAESFGLLVRVDGIPGESILSNGASAHLAMTLENPLACGVMQNIRLSREFVTRGGMRFENGQVTLPDTPGLGAEEIDEDLLQPV